MESDTERDVPLVPSAPNPSNHQPLRAAKSTAFKRQERRKRKDRKRQERLALELERWEPLGAPPPRPAATNRCPEPDTPWPCDSTPPQDPAAASSWTWGPPADPPPPPTVAAAASQPHPQVVAVRSCRAFFEEHAAYDEDEDEDGEEGEVNAARFFAELLGGDAALRDFYEAEREKGQFLCLVCEGTGARIGKRFAGCAALVQHAASVARTKRRLAHRAFADAVGRLLRWGAGRTAPTSEGCDNDGTSDRADDLGVPQKLRNGGVLILTPDRCNLLVQDPTVALYFTRCRTRVHHVNGSEISLVLCKETACNMLKLIELNPDHTIEMLNLSS